MNEDESWKRQDIEAHWNLFYQLGREGKLKMDLREASAPREFASGAKRDSEVGKLNFIGAMSPFAVEAYLDYLRRHNNSAHRSEENWKKGIPLDSFMASEARHFLEQWKLHATGHTAVTYPEMIDSICGVIFNAFGYLHELTKPEPRSMLVNFIEDGKK